jgi:hypothetical protein
MNVYVVLCFKGLMAVPIIQPLMGQVQHFDYGTKTFFKIYEHHIGIDASRIEIAQAIMNYLLLQNKKSNFSQ